MRKDLRVNQGRKRGWNGFALVLTVVLLLLLALVAVGLLTLSTVSVRTSGSLVAKAEAEANARLSLMLAIGELQKLVGPDQRITASSNILDDNPGEESSDGGVARPHMLGVWESHTGWLNREGADRPIQETYQKGREAAFLRWLSPTPDPKTLESLDFVQSAGDDRDVLFVSALEGRSEVRMDRIETEGGGLSWWIGGENQKAHAGTTQRQYEHQTDRVVGATFPVGVRTGVLEGLTNPEDGASDQFVDFRSLELGLQETASERAIQARLHDLTAESFGVLANVRNGGLRKDLNLFFERPSRNVDREVRHLGALRSEDPTTLPRPQFLDNINFPSWYKLSQFYGLQNDRVDGGGLLPTTAPRSQFYWSPENLNQSGWDRVPLVTRLMLLFFAERQAGSAPDKVSYRIGINPVLVVWNPFNAQLDCPAIGFDLNPYNLEYQVHQNRRVYIPWSEMPTGSLTVRVRSQFSLAPGETKIFSHSGGSAPVLDPGFNEPNQGVGYYLNIPRLQNVTDSRDFELSLRLNDVVKPANDRNGGRFQVYWTLVDTNNRGLRFNELAANPCRSGAPLDIVSDRPGERFLLSGLGNGDRENMASFQFVLKTGEDLRNPAPYDEEDLRCRNYIHADPTTHRAMSGSATEKVKTLSQYMVWVQQGSGNQVIPDWDPDSDRAYYGAGITAAQGQGQVPLVELSPVPITSLAALRHFKLTVGRTGWNNGLHHWELAVNQAQGFANSFAHPMIPSDGVYTNAPEFTNAFASRPQFRRITDQWDRGLLCNDAMWDEWFCTGIADYTVGPLGGTRTVDQSVTEWLSASRALPNSRLVPYLSGLPISEIQSRFLRGRAAADRAYAEAGRYMLLQGAFNVNSTSVEAWKVFLSTSSGGTFVHQTGNGLAESEVTEELVRVSRFAIPVSAQEGSGPHDQAAWTGVRFLTPEQIDRLARECVHQVKLRGPFLNMSDFINRRLGAGELARCGALQAAIDWDEFNGNTPQPSSPESINGRFKGPEDYISEPLAESRFPDAAKGSRYAGIPGYVTQGDLPRPHRKRTGGPGRHVSVSAATASPRIRVDASWQPPCAKLWCSATPDYLDATDLPEIAAEELESEINKRFGRRFQVVSFRWLSRAEI